MEASRKPRLIATREVLKRWIFRRPTQADGAIVAVFVAYIGLLMYLAWNFGPDPIMAEGGEVWMAMMFFIAMVMGLIAILRQATRVGGTRIGVPWVKPVPILVHEAPPRPMNDGERGIKGVRG